MQISDHIYAGRFRKSNVNRIRQEEFYSDKSRIVFCSSFRRMMQKAQVFSLESNTSVRNRLTHSLEVSDVGRTLARKVGLKLVEARVAELDDVECMQSIVENACLIHDIGNPPFGHFGESAIKRWFTAKAPKMMDDALKTTLNPPDENAPPLADFQNFDGNPQGFRIVTRLHSEIDEHGLNLSHSTLLASIKYPHCGSIQPDALFSKKVGVYSSEKDIYEELHTKTSVKPNQRYFLAYLMELADDICYCLSDIADSFEKGITSSRDFKEEFRKICRRNDLDSKKVIPEGAIIHFGTQVSISVSRLIVSDAVHHFVDNIDAYLNGEKEEILPSLEHGQFLLCFKEYARKFIYTAPEAQRIEVAGARIVEGLLDHYGSLLRLSREDFRYFLENSAPFKGRDLDTEWRIFNLLSPRMRQVYQSRVKVNMSDTEEWIERARLIVDYISGLTDNSALRFYQNFMGITL